MCQEYVCSDCSTPDWDRCGVASEAGLHGARCEFLQQTSQRHKCTICRRVGDVIDKLERLAFQEPWRLNDGPELQDWEKEGIFDERTVIEGNGEESSEVRVSLQHEVKADADLPVLRTTRHGMHRHVAVVVPRAESVNISATPLVFLCVQLPPFCSRPN